MAAIFFAFVVLVGIWGTFFLGNSGGLGSFQLSLPAAGFFTGMVVLTAAGWFVFKKLKAKAASKELDKTLNAQADDQEKNARPDLQPQIVEMRAEFQKAVGSLKSSRLGRSGADALSALPWYVIIGPPGTGKSTALRNSGLKFPYLGKKGGVRGVGGTRNCDWWLTNEGVILDTAGRYVTEEDDQEEWLSFLDAVSKSRPRRPINGLIVTVSAADLLNEDEAGAAAMGAQLRERVDEVTGRLHLLVPVYLLVTKCDLLSGFVETFGHLPKSERGQVWGCTFPVGAEHEDGPGEMVREKIDELTDVLFERATARMAQERKMEAREKIFRFPRQLQLLRAGLGEVSQALFTENPYQDTPILRGVYFTSGTQEGRPIDKVMSAMADAFGLRGGGPSSSEAPTDARSYFLGGLFLDVIFKDHKLARRSSRAVQLQKQRRYLYAGVAVAISALLIVWPLLAFSSMRSQANVLVEQVKDVAKVSDPTDRLGRLEVLRKALIELREQESSTVTGIGSFGMNRRDQLARAVEPIYGQWMRDLVVMDVLGRDEKGLAELAEPGGPPPTVRRVKGGPKPPEPPSLEVTFERLKRHMLLSLQPKEPPSTNAELYSIELRSLARPMAEDFKDKGPSVDASVDAIAQGLELMFAIWPQHREEWKVERRPEYVRKGQAALRDMNRTQRLLNLAISRWSQQAQDMTLTRMLGEADTSVFETEKKVRAAFTAAVWKDKAKADLAEPPSDDEAWIQGAEPVSGDQLRQDLQHEYYLQYVREWTQMLKSIELRAVDDPTDVRRRLEGLTDPKSSPLKAIFKSIQDNLVLASTDARSVTETFAPLVMAGPTNPLLGKVLKTAGLSSERTLDMDRYERLLNGFAKQVEEAKDPATSAKVANDLRAEVRNLTSLVTKSNKTNNAVYEQVLEQLWIRPIRRMADALDSETRAGLNAKWCADVYSLHRSALKGRYPFARAGADASLEEMVQLYGGKGKLWDFYKASLDGNKVRDQGETFTPIGGEALNGSLVTYLTRAKTFREALFPGESPEPVVEFTVQIRLPPKAYNVLGANFFMDDQQARQDTGPVEPPFKMHWPGGPKGPQRAMINIILKGAKPKVIGCRGEAECSGTFAFFRLLDQGKVENKGPRSFTISWPVELGTDGAAELKMDFTWSRSVSAFYGREGARASSQLLSLFRELDPPAAIVPGVEGCK